MGLFDFGKNKAVKALELQVQQLQQVQETIELKALNNLAFQNLSTAIKRNIAIYPKEDIDYADRYCTDDNVFSLVRMLAGTAALIPIYAYLVTDDEAQKKLNKIKRPHTKPFEVKALQLKALEDLPETDRVEMLMERPNQQVSKMEFYEALYSFLFFRGNAIIYKERPDNGVNAGFTTQMHILYPQHISLKVTETLPRRIVFYDYKINGNVIYENIPPEDIIHIKYFNPNMDYYGSELWGLSPLDVLKKRLARMDSGMDTSVAQMQNGGVETIVFDKSMVGMDGKKAVEIMGQMKDNFYRFLSDTRNYGAPYFAGGEMGSISLGSTLKDLGAYELDNVDFKKLCNAYGTSDVLFNSDVSSTYENVNTMEKRSYTNTILPNVYRVRDALKLSLLEEFEKGRKISEVDRQGNITVREIQGDGIKRDLREDISEIPSLQEDMGKMVTWMAQAYWVTANEKREMMKFDKLEDPIYDEPFLPLGIQTAEDFVMPDPVEQVTPNGD